MHYVHVTSGVVDNRIIFAEPMPDDWEDRDNWHANEEAQIGWSYADGAFAPPPPAPEPDQPAPAPQNEVLFDHENRLRTLEGQPPLTQDEFTKLAK